jgi:transglutaminase-like putative cysteine protease
MEFEIKCHLGYEVSGPASFLFNVAVAQNSFQRIITEHFDLAGADSPQEMVIGGQRYHRVTAQSGSVELVYEAVVDATHELFGDPSRLQVPLFEQIPAEAMVFIYPSRFCQSDLLARLAKREFNQDESGFYRVTRICNWIFERIEYLSGTTTQRTSAFDTVTELAGVSRDFAHLAIAFCRSLGIWSRTTCPQHLDPVQCARSSTVEQGGSDRIGSSAPREKLRYRRENPVDVGHRHTRLRTGLGFPMTGKRLLRDAQNPGRHRLVP